MRTILLLFVVFFCANIYAQTEIDSGFLFNSKTSKSDTIVVDTTGKIDIKMDASIESLLKKKIIVNENYKKINGYRIQIFSVTGASSMDKANKKKAEFLMRYPDADVYIVYNTPYYKVRIGDFRNKLDAKKYLQTIAKDYPNEAIVVVDKVNIPKVKEKNESIEINKK